MSLFWRKAAVIATSLLFLPACSAAQTVAAPVPGAPASKMSQAKARKHAASKPPVAPATLPPQPPPPPLTPEQMPAAPPQVTYSNGLLSIVATNSTLSDILHAVGARTGATVDAPAPLTRERVAAHIGPGTPREVLSDLLTGPRFGYILVGSDGDSNAVSSIIILTANQSSPSAGAAMAQQPPVRAAMPPQAEAEEEVEEEQPSPPQPETPPAQPPQQPAPGQRSFVPQQPPNQVGGPPPTSGEGGQQIRSPEQMLEQLRRMQPQGNQQQNNPQ